MDLFMEQERKRQPIFFIHCLSYGSGFIKKYIIFIAELFW